MQELTHEKVLQRALKNGLITQEQAAKMTEHEIAQLLFESGFSTADKISDISGRGVGLDVVKTKIQSLGGHVSVESNRSWLEILCPAAFNSVDHFRDADPSWKREICYSAYLRSWKRQP